jgi:hypothetical protein
MLTKEQKIQIDRLSEEGWNVSEIAKQMKLDWKTVKRCISQRSQENMGLPSRDNNQLEENELTKVIFQKLNAGIPPDKIVGEIGHVDLVTSLYQKRKSLRGLNKSNSSLPDPLMLKSFEAWEESFEKYYDWHFGRVIRAIGEVGYQRMILCPNYKNKDVECCQIENNDPYKCVSCSFFSGEDAL